METIETDLRVHVYSGRKQWTSNNGSRQSSACHVMGDTMSALTALQNRISRFVTMRAWHQFHSPKNLSMALSVEAAELMEHFQWLSQAESADLAPAKKREVAAEMADVFIYLLRMAEQLEVDLIEAAERKMDENAEKYPVGKSKGNATKYTDFDR